MALDVHSETAEKTAVEVGHDAPAHRAGGHAAPAGAPTPRKKNWISWLVLVVVAGGYVGIRGKEKAIEDGHALVELAKEQVVGKPAPVIEEVVSSHDFKPWDGFVLVTKKERDTMGMNIVPVKAQSEPIQLELSGTTDYDQNSLARVRPLFDARVQRVLKSTGEKVSKGEPLVELFSNELLAAKHDCQTKFVQWDHDLKLLESRRPLIEKGAITQVAWAETQNAEKKSRVEYIQIREKLLVFGLTNPEIEGLLKNLGDGGALTFSEEESKQLSRMTVKSPIDGVVVERNVVPGNFYDANDIIMVISPMDHLWVWANIFEKDQSKVRLGQGIEVRFPFLQDFVKGKVEAIDNRVDPTTRALRVRASIPNPSTDLKAEMLVRAYLDVDPIEGGTTIPRNAMSVINGEYCAFVQRKDDPDKFERRMIEIEQETAYNVIVRKGLHAGDNVVTNGSLLMSQLYEDLSTLSTGTPAR